MFRDSSNVGLSAIDVFITITGVIRTCHNVGTSQCTDLTGQAFPELGLTDATGTFCTCTTALCNMVIETLPPSTSVHPTSPPSTAANPTAALPTSDHPTTPQATLAHQTSASKITAKQTPAPPSSSGGNMTSLIVIICIVVVSLLIALAAIARQRSGTVEISAHSSRLFL